MDWRSVESNRDPAASVAASELRPSIRDFAQHLGAGRRTLGVIPLLVAASPASVIGDVAALARALDELDVPALAVGTATGSLAARLAELAAVAAAVSAPVLRWDCVASETRLYESRLAGADAVLVPVAIAAGELSRVVELARAIHVVAVAEVATRDECEAAVAARVPVIALAPGCLALAGNVPVRHPLIGQEPIAGAADLARLHRRVDAVLVATPPAAVDDIAALADAAAALPA